MSAAIRSVRLPVERLEELWPERLRGARIGAVLHAASVTGDLVATLDVLDRHAAGGLFQLAALFGPQHGFGGTTQDNMIEWQGFTHPRLGIPVHSLYGEHREPTPDMLHGVDALVIDLQDVGSRYYTFIWTMFLCLKACAQAGVQVVVCDRPNPINGIDTEGEPQDREFLSFVGLWPLDIRHARTIGELALQFRREIGLDVDLYVLPMNGWVREMWWDDTGLPWIPPSPNMPTLDTATVYPGMCLLEGTNLSEGRGTTRPFEFFGAPWIPDEHDFAARLNALGLPGVRFREAVFEPAFQKHAGSVCRGAQLHVTDRSAFRPVRTGIDILRLVKDLCPDSFRWNDPPYEYEFEKLPIEILLGGPLPERVEDFPQES